MIQGIKRLVGLGRKGPPIPYVRLQGVIKAPNPTGPRARDGLHIHNVEAPLARAFANKRAPAVMLGINSPGGSPTQSNLIRKRIRELAEKHEKKVIVHAEDVAASGGYVLMLAGDELFCDDASVVGNVGVVAGLFGFDKLIESWKIDRRLRTAGKYKVLVDPFSPEDPEAVKMLDARLAHLHDWFRSTVKEVRGSKLNPDTLEEVMEAGVFIGQRAVDAGLVDGLGTATSIIREKYGDGAYLARTMDIRKPSALSSLMGVSVGDAAGEAAASAVEAAMSTAEDKAAWSRYATQA